MVDKLPTSCGLHLCDEGATRRHLCGLIGGKYENIPTWSKGQKQAISEFLISVQLPSEIHRKLRGLNVIRYWKGTEFRSYLLYVSPVLMEDVLPEKAYCHFLLYFCGVTIFSSSFHRRHWERAAEFLNSFVKDYGKIYGRGELTSNVHNIQHIARDCFNYGPLHKHSTYDYENYLQILKRSSRSGFRCSVQVAARYEERSATEVAAASKKRKFLHLTRNAKGIFLESNFILNPLPRDQWLLTKGNGIIQFLGVEKSNGCFIVSGKQFECSSSLFSFALRADDPESVFSSLDILIHKVDANVQTCDVNISLLDIRCKLVAVYPPSKPGTVVFPLFCIPSSWIKIH